MEEKFIEGTDEQYSIREDGVVTRHYKFLRNKKIVYEKSFLKGIKDVRCSTVQFIICKKQYTRNRLLIEYFGKKPCANPKCSVFITKFLYVYCEKCQLENDKKARQKYKKKHYDKLLEKAKKQRLIDNDNLPRHRIASLLGISVKDLSDNLYEYHRNFILLKRKIAREHNININSLK